MPESAEQWVCTASGLYPEQPFSIIKGSAHQLFRLLAQPPQKAPAAYLQWFCMSVRAPGWWQYPAIPTNTPQYPTNTFSKARPIPYQYPRALQLCFHFLLTWPGSLKGLPLSARQSSPLSLPSSFCSFAPTAQPHLRFVYYRASLDAAGVAGILNG